MGDAPSPSALARLVDALAEEGIRFQFAGMTAAILQGVPATTLDTDIWLELPERRYVKALDIAKKLGAEILARTVVALDDDTLVNFLYRIDGLKTFADKYERAEVLDWLGRQIRVLPLQRIIASKKHIRRPKDIAHLPLLNQTLKLKAIRRIATEAAPETPPSPWHCRASPRQSARIQPACLQAQPHRPSCSAHRP